MTIKEAIASLNMDAEHVAIDTAEVKLSKQAQRFIDAVRVVTQAIESMPVWTPCSDGMPEDDDRFCAWMQLEATIDTNGRRATRTVGRFYSPTLKKWFWADGWTGYPTEDGKGIEDANIGNVVAWRYPAPYRADDTTGKVKED